MDMMVSSHTFVRKIKAALRLHEKMKKREGGGGGEENVRITHARVRNLV